MRTVIGLAAVTLFLGCFIDPPTSHADICPYPGVGMGANVLFGSGFFCDMPQEVNGAHSHCESGRAGLGGAFLFGGDNGSLGLGGGGVGGWSCTWRCPDGAMAPAPNPPGAWQHYLVPMTNSFCAAHMAPNGFWSAPVLPTEGIPPVNEQAPQPGEMLPPQPVPPAMPTPGPGPAPITPTPQPIPGEPNALQPAPGEPNP